MNPTVIRLVLLFEGPGAHFGGPKALFGGSWGSLWGSWGSLLGSWGSLWGSWGSPFGHKAHLGGSKPNDNQNWLDFDSGGGSCFNLTATSGGGGGTDSILESFW